MRGNPDYAHHIVHEDDDSIVFLNKYPTLKGYCLVAPKRHLSDLAEDLSESQHLQLQAVVHRLARAFKRTLPAERIYVLSLGSVHGNSHLHWHVAPLPPGVPYEQQQYYSLMAENGIFDLPAETMADLARSIGDTFRAGG